VALSDDNSGKAACSTDNGATWTALSLPKGRWNSLAFGNGSFVALSLFDGNVLRSEDGASLAADAASWTVKQALPDLSGKTSSLWQTVVFGQ
jgi:hypothetical protein